MSNRYVSDPSRGIFDDSDDVDDDEFLSRVRSNIDYRNNLLGNNYGNQELENAQRQKQQVIETTREIEERTLLSTERSLRLLRESEKIGIDTAEELLRQKEQLKHTDELLNGINTDLHASQHHIQGIKSIFGSFKNILSGKSPRGTLSKEEPTSSQLTNGVRKSTLNETLKQANSDINSMTQHPGLRIRGIVDKESTTPTIDSSLNEILESVTRLKGLSLGLSEELDSQNKLVENITSKAENIDIHLERQNKDLNRILKK